MALTPPDTDDLLLHMQRTDPFSETGDPSEDDIATASLQRATDLMEYATDLHVDPTEDDYRSRILREGILAMAHSILISGGDDREALYSPFSSERIGSYSYTMRAQQQVASGLPVGVPEFDLAVALWQGDGAGAVSAFGANGEKVFVEPFPAAVATEEARARWPDPSIERSVGDVV